MYVVVFVMPEKHEGNQLSKEQLANLRELAAGFGALMAQQLHGEVEEEDGSDAADGDPELEFAETEPVVADAETVSYLEDCFRLQ